MVPQDNDMSTARVPTALLAHLKMNQDKSRAARVHLDGIKILVDSQCAWSVRRAHSMVILDKPHCWRARHAPLVSTRM